MNKKQPTVTSRINEKKKRHQETKKKNRTKSEKEDVEGTANKND